MLKPVNVELEDFLYSDAKALATNKYNGSVCEVFLKAIRDFEKRHIRNYNITDLETIKKIDPKHYKELTRPLTKEEKINFSIDAAFLEEKIRRATCSIEELEEYMKIRYRTIFLNPPLLPQSVQGFDCTLNLLAGCYVSTYDLALKKSIIRHFENTRIRKSDFIKSLREKQIKLH